ncbi:fimbrial protein [Dyella monticola]|uniref:fimbrial protein n=1 Tax=Dyella monticola TaxID=1927958 RepID=UPI001313D856|nr:fimbrial protein [Dyella monticola]
MNTQTTNLRIKPLVALVVLLAAGGFAHIAPAQGTGSATVNVTGNITGDCSITAGSTVALNIGSIPAANLPSVGSTSTASPAQNITITCTANPGITMTLNGTQLAGQPNTVLQLSSSGAGAAGGVGVQILNNGTGTPTTALQIGARNTIPTAATVTIPVAARYYRAGAVTAGTANATATLNFTFN